MWFIGVEVQQETSAPPPKKNPGSAPGEVIYPPQKTTEKNRWLCLFGDFQMIKRIYQNITLLC